MERRRYAKLTTAALAIGGVAVFAMSLASLGFAPMGDHGAHGAMGGCPFAGYVAFCPMSMSAHLVHWRSTFVNISVPSGVNALMLLTLILPLVAWFVYRRREILLMHCRKRHPPGTPQYDQRESDAVSRAQLRWAFAQGILHPKIYPQTIR